MRTRAGVKLNGRQSFHASIERAGEPLCHIFLTGLPADETAGFLALAIRAEAWIAEFESRELQHPIGRSADPAPNSQPGAAELHWKWAFCKEWLRLGGVVTSQKQLGEWAALLYDARSQSDAREVAREELASAAG
jgi:hypothetical protein